MTTIILSKQGNSLLRARLTPYLDALTVTVAALGLEGDWRYDPQIGALVSIETKADISTEPPAA